MSRLHLIFILFCFNLVKNSCIPWQHSYLNFEFTSQNKITFTAVKLNRNSYFGIGFSSTPYVNNETIIITGTKNSIFQIFNHKNFLNTSEEIIESKKHQNTMENIIDDLLIFQFTINS